MRHQWTSVEVYVLAIVVNFFYTAPRGPRLADGGSFGHTFGIYDYGVRAKYALAPILRIDFQNVTFDYPPVIDRISNQPGQGIRDEEQNSLDAAPPRPDQGHNKTAENPQRDSKSKSSSRMSRRTSMVQAKSSYVSKNDLIVDLHQVVTACDSPLSRRAMSVCPPTPD